jgi:hypothetical protein
MHGPLRTLLADGVIEEVCGRLSGDLWLVRRGPPSLEHEAARRWRARGTLVSAS